MTGWQPPSFLHANSVENPKPPIASALIAAVTGGERLLKLPKIKRVVSR
jgi:hypothetical protein